MTPSSEVKTVRAIAGAFWSLKYIEVTCLINSGPTPKETAAGLTAKFLAHVDSLSIGMVAQKNEIPTIAKSIQFGHCSNLTFLTSGEASEVHNKTFAAFEKAQRLTEVRFRISDVKGTNKKEYIYHVLGLAGITLSSLP